MECIQTPKAIALGIRDCFICAQNGSNKEDRGLGVKKHGIQGKGIGKVWGGSLACTDKSFGGPRGLLDFGAEAGAFWGQWQSHTLRPSCIGVLCSAKGRAG